MAEKIRIMHVTGALKVGGVDELLLITAKYNLAHKYDLAFTACDTSDGYMGQQIQNLGYKTFSLGISTRVYDLRLIPRLVKVLKEYQPHIVHFYFKISFLGRIAAKLAGVPIIISNEVDIGWEDYSFGLRIAAMLKRKMDFLIDKAIPCSEAVRTYWDKNNSSKYVTIYLPIDLEKFAPLKRQPSEEGYKNGNYPVIGIVSRVHPGKGHEDLIRAMTKILEVFPKARLRIIGTGPLLEEMQNLSKSLNLNGAVEFTGFVEDLYPELSALDVFVLPSLTEGFPLSVMEAMAMGLPVAATPVGGVPEMVEPGQTGLLFPPKSPDGLADAVLQILSDPKKARKMGEQGRQKVFKEYRPEKYIQQLDSLYQELLAAKGVCKQEQFA
ncbi:MAG TPA: glycosyltransferase [Anaerolineae bacterium]|nr:glycosyltransferase [Anaerolineae bacterium]